MKRISHVREVENTSEKVQIKSLLHLIMQIMHCHILLPTVHDPLSDNDEEMEASRKGESDASHGNPINQTSEDEDTSPSN